MTTFVTGATGYIGSAVVRQLLDKGKTVRCLVRETSSLKNLAGLDVEPFYDDIRGMDSLSRALDGCDNVYHPAAVYANWLPDAGLMYQVNEEGTRNVLAACKTAGVKKSCIAAQLPPWAPTAKTRHSRLTPLSETDL
jgi:dihydroflavonol-4-reductase